MIQHVPGDVMIADIGAKAFTAARLEFLNKLMGMGILKAVGDQKAEGEKKQKKEKEKKES